MVWFVIWLLVVQSDQRPTAQLPPLIEWHGVSESLLVAEGDQWITPAEANSFRYTPDYHQTYDWLERLVSASSHLELMTIGKTASGYDLRVVIASTDRAFSAAALKRSGKPTLFVQAGIHAGEIDGKDATLMLLRDMTVKGTKSALLDRCNLIFLPIFNVDGHERTSAFNRINQRGPEVMGWRTNSQNLNLNRDYAKIDTPELQSLVAFLNEWLPDLYFDVHVTDGIDYQYDITYGWVGTHGYSPAIATWLDQQLRPALDKDLTAAGHIPGPLVFAIDDTDVSKGIIDWMGGPRFSSSYGDARHLPTVLIENHSLKPYRQRVLGTYVLIESAMTVLATQHASLAAATRRDLERRLPEVNLAWRVGDSKPENIPFLGVQYEVETSPITNGKVARWLGRPQSMEIPYIRMTQPSLAEPVPRAYWVPGQWREVIRRLKIHGIEMTQIDRPQKIELQMLRLADPVFEDQPFEGHVRVTAGYQSFSAERWLGAGSVRIPGDQPLIDLAMLLLEPGSQDSFFQWGFFHAVLQPTEYAEAYAMEPYAEKMLQDDPALVKEWHAALESDPEMRVDPRLRLQWFYRRSLYFDQEYLVYPVGREL